MSRLAFVRDERFKQHLNPDAHPESPRRLDAIDTAWAESGLTDIVKELSPREAGEDEIALVHDEADIEQLRNYARQAKGGRLVQLDGDTFMSEKSYETAKLAVGAGLVAVDAVAEQGFDSSFAAVRPPGHHALSDRAMGFCLFNNIAVATCYARRKLGLKRVLIVDVDVHHGNGTQSAFDEDPGVCFMSLHQYPLFPPNSGWYTEDGTGEGQGFSLNIPLPEGTGDRGYLSAFDRLVSPVCLEYKPQLIMVSAGYDAHKNDPLACQQISTRGYALLFQRLVDLSLPTGAKIVCFLEGGYNTKALSESVLATMRVLSGSSNKEETGAHIPYLVPGGTAGQELITGDQSPHLVDERVNDVRRHFSQYWQSLR